VAERGRVQDFWKDFREATQLRLDKDFEAAREAYRRALENNPEHEDALYYLGNVNLELGNWEAARATWQRLVEVNPSSSRGFSQLGSLALCRPEIPAFDLVAARSAFESAHRLNPEETGPALRLGQVALLQKSVAEAADLFDAVTGQNFTNLEAHYLKAYTEWLGGRGDAGLQELNGIIAEIESLPKPPVMGEGDTKTGRILGPSEEAGCPIFEPFIEAMQGAARPLGRAVLEHYEELQEVLAVGSSDSSR
jgi:tetratricopeptide (TPR) repeat protein